MPTLGQVFQIFVLPAIFVGVALLIAWWPPSRKRDGRWMGAIAIGGGFAIAACAIYGFPHWPPGKGDASYRLIWLSFAVAGVGISVPRNSAGLVLFFICFNIFWLAAPLLRTLDTASDRWLYVLTAVATVSWWILETFSVQVSSCVFPTLIALEFAGWAAVMGMSDNVKISQICASMAAMAIVAALLAIPLGTSFNRGAIWAWTLLLFFMLAYVHLYSYAQPPTTSIVLLLISPVLAFSGDLLPAKRLKPHWRLTVRLLPAFIAVAAAVGITAQQFFSASADKNQTDSY